jgi:SNF2-related domain
VGQWIEEAKSKLTNPGLVYSYHGGNRKREPRLLAENSIVVTTYETLASDATFHASKSGDSDYCPPCEQVRWWRIICDESHVLRNGNNQKSRTVKDLVADNKWLVSGKSRREGARPSLFFRLLMPHLPSRFFNVRNTCEHDVDGPEEPAQFSGHSRSQRPNGVFQRILLPSCKRFVSRKEK